MPSSKPQKKLVPGQLVRVQLVDEVGTRLAVVLRRAIKDVHTGKTRYYAGRWTINVMPKGAETVVPGRDCFHLHVRPQDVVPHG